MATDCRFSFCKWSGDVNDLFNHCETYHSHYIKENDAKKSFSFSFEDMVKETFLLNGPDGLYWFLLDPQEHESGIRRGIFAIGESDICNYTGKIGRINDGYVTYFGPYQTQRDTSTLYELEWSYLDLEFYNKHVPHKYLEIYFGDYEDKEVYTGTYHDVNWDDPEEQKYNEWCVEKFTCLFCLEFIKSNARFCENRHFVCHECLQKWVAEKEARCPMCRVEYSYDCADEAIEELLKCVRFPDAQ